MAEEELKSYSLAEMKAKYVGTKGAAVRDKYENKLRIKVDLLAKREQRQRSLKH